MSAKTKVKAVKMYAYSGEGETDGMMFYEDRNRYYRNPCYVLPADAESFDAMCLQIGKVLSLEASSPEFAPFFNKVDAKRAMKYLAAIGITKPKRPTP